MPLGPPAWASLIHCKSRSELWTPPRGASRALSATRADLFISHKMTNTLFSFQCLVKARKGKASLPKAMRDTNEAGKGLLGQIQGNSGLWVPGQLPRWSAWCSGPLGAVVPPTHLHGCWGCRSPPEPVGAPPGPAVHSVTPQDAWAENGAMRLVDSCVKDGSHGQEFSHTEEEPSHDPHGHYDRDEDDEEDFPGLQGSTRLLTHRRNNTGANSMRGCVYAGRRTCARAADSGAAGGWAGST